LSALLGPLVEWCERAPLDHMLWLPGQDAFHRATSKRRLFRAGNQAHGKTTAGCAELIWRCLGWHPRKTVRPPPVRWWAISSSEKQSGTLQKKLWDLVPKSQVDPRTWYDETKGAFVGKYPLIRFRNGSVIEFRWTGSRSLNLAGASLDGVWFDEPPATQRAFTEIERRLTRTGGDLLATLTPVNAPVGYLRAFCEAGRIEDLWYPLRPEHLIPVGATRPIRTEDGVPMDADWIEEQRHLVPLFEQPVVLDGEWEFRRVGSVFEGAWDPRRHLHDLVFPPHSVKLTLGTDFGGENLRQYSILMAVDDSGDWPEVWAIDEYTPDGPSTMEEDVQGVLGMLSRNGVRWHELDYAFADKKWSGRKHEETKKMVESFQRAVEDTLRLRRGTLRPVIQNVKKGKDAGAGSRERGVRFLYQCMVRRDREHFHVSQACPLFAKALGGWDWTETLKDQIDGARYALKPWILGSRAPLSVSTVHIRR
jgi:hypothetical protein